MGLRTTINSGAFDFSKGDLEGETFLVEAKFTDKTQYTLKHSTLEKIVEEAEEVGKTPMLVIIFTKYAKDYVLIPKDYLGGE